MKIVFTLITFVVLFVVFIRFIEFTSIFYPVRPLAADPEDIGLPFEDVYITTRDRVQIHGWLIKSLYAKSTLVFFHGNAGNIGDRLGKIGLFHHIYLNVLIIDYRGYGKSNGQPSE